MGKEGGVSFHRNEWVKGDVAGGEWGKESDVMSGDETAKVTLHQAVHVGTDDPMVPDVHEKYQIFLPEPQAAAMVGGSV